MKYTSSGTAFVSRREKLLFIQLAIACIYPIVFNEYWLHLHHVLAEALTLPGPYTNAFANVLWITVNGLNPFLYLTLNTYYSLLLSSEFINAQKSVYF